MAGSVAVTVAVLALWFRSALLWYRAARAMRARPSFRRVTAIGLVLVPCTMAATLVALMASPGPT